MTLPSSSGLRFLNFLKFFIEDLGLMTGCFTLDGILNPLDLKREGLCFAPLRFILVGESTSYGNSFPVRARLFAAVLFLALAAALHLGVFQVFAEHGVFLLQI
jgi:hypothetical protein